MRWLVIPALAGALHVGAPLGSGAQASSVELPSQLSATTRTAIERVADSLRAAGLPAAPIYAKAAEGVLKGAQEGRILSAVRILARELDEARAQLGATSTEAELVAGASALHVGVPGPMLRRLAGAAGEGSARASLATPLVVLTDLVSRRVPAFVAGAAIDSLIGHRANAEEYGALRSAVERDIAAGRAPDAATLSRTRAILGTLPSRGSSQRDGGRGPAVPPES